MLRVLTLAALLATLGACGSLEPDRDFLTLYVAPNTVDCVGMVPQQCMLTKERPDDDWTYFYGEIVGFTYEPGFNYTLRVERRHIRNPPADGSSYEYRLVEVLVKEAAAP